MHMISLQINHQSFYIYYPWLTVFQTYKFLLSRQVIWIFVDVVAALNMVIQTIMLLYMMMLNMKLLNILIILNMMILNLMTLNLTY